MKLPNSEFAEFDIRKLNEYLLSATHPIGRSKSVFFSEIGCNKNNTEALKQVLLNIAKNGMVLEKSETAHGTKYIIDGLISSPKGNKKALRTVWIIDKGHDHPRFVTAYPA
ncbi:MAG: hypothetical protein HY036_06110 [Nitrospirae bacterium]|nr:hypothetical protein [Nitrospirota bacterium]MBI3352135.1 hypothetical protein [Nitrospirota bacterium]